MLVEAVMLWMAVRVMLTGLAPQLKVTAPPPLSAVLKAASVQEPGVPLPTTPAARAGRAPNRARTTKSATRGKAKRVERNRRDMETPCGYFDDNSVKPICFPECQ